MLKLWPLRALGMESAREMVVTGESTGEEKGSIKASFRIWKLNQRSHVKVDTKKIQLSIKIKASITMRITRKSKKKIQKKTSKRHKLKMLTCIHKKLEEGKRKYSSTA